MLLAAVRGRGPAPGARRAVRGAGGRSRAPPGDVRRGAHAWIGEAGDVSSLN